MSDKLGGPLGFRYRRLITDSGKMSFIFAGLARRDIELSTGSEIVLDLKEKYQFKVGKEKREIFFCIEGQNRAEEFLLFSRNERFCQYTQKVFVLENVINFVPRIFFWFKIDYAVQLALRFIVRIISGSEDEDEI